MNLPNSILIFAHTTWGLPPVDERLFCPYSWSFLVVGLLLIAAVLRCISLTREKRRLSASCTNMCTLMGIAGLDYFIMDANGNYLMRPQNEKFWKFQDGHPLSPQECLDPVEAEEYEKQFTLLKNRRIDYLQVTYRINDQEEDHYFSLRIVPGPDRNTPCFIGTVHEEMTSLELKRSCRDTITVLEQIINELPCPVFVKDAENDFRYLLTNDAFRKEMNLPADEIIGRTDFELFDVQEEAETLHKNDLHARKKNGKVIHVMEQQTDSSGNILILNSLKKIIDSSDGRKLLLGVSVDVSEEEKTRKMLVKALEKANNANKAKTLFLASVSHELRTPLNAVVGFSELMQNQKLTQAERMDYLRSINYAGNTLLNLINDLLDLSKLEAEKLILELAPVNIRELFDGIIRSFKPRCMENNITLSFHTPDSMPTFFMLDDIRLRQVIFNLLGNAVKFTKNGSIQIDLNFMALQQIDDLGTISFYIKDSGVGISQEDLKTIFEPFAQSMNHIPGSQSYQSTGLGLPITQKMVRRMGGEILVESEPGKGSCFTVNIPNVRVCKPMLPAVKEKRQIRNFSLSDAKIMIVDDVPMNLKVLSSMLKKLQVPEIITCNSALEVLDKVKETNPTMILADLWMPEMKGDELAEKLHQDPDTADIPFVVITADSQAENSGLFSDILLKPVTLEKLRNAIANCHRKEEDQ
ncbi:MAG: response regulator [Lentisphaeria bacterium]|nr:response regulator [Lentisphaeria bacterium]